MTAKAAPLDLDDYLPYLVNRVGIIIAEQFAAEALEPHDLSIAMWRVMAVLASKGHQRQIDLAEYTSIEVSTLSRIVTRLVRMGAVSRTRSTRSSREVIVRLTAKGSTQAARIIPLARQCEATASAGLQPRELAELKSCLRRVYANMRKRAAARARLGGRIQAEAAE